MELNGAGIVLKALVDQGVDVVFGYPGGAVLPLYDELFKQNHIRHILVRHEQAAVHAAEGYARSTGKVGVVIVTSGPGATNTITGLTDAIMDSIPIVCLSGQVPTTMIGNDAFQEADTVGITRQCTKHNYLVRDINELGDKIHEAFYIARTGRPGPVLVDMPKDVLNTKGEYKGIAKIGRKSYKPCTYGDEEMIRQAVEMIAGAKRPIFYTGGGVINSGRNASKLLTKFVRMTGYPCTNTLMGLGGFPASDKQFLHMLGMHGSYEANMAMARCDVMINIGARFDDRVTGKLESFSPHSKKIHVDIDPSSINKTVDVDIAVKGDACLVLEKMIEIWEKKKYKPDQEALKEWWSVIEGWRAKDSYGYKQPESGETKPQYALDRLNAALQGKDFYLSTDVGQHQMWSAQYIRFDEPHRWLTSGGLGTMGYGMPAAVGAQIANPNSLVICVTGEASIMMNIQELATICQYKLPVKIFIMNNRYMGMVRQWQEMFHGNRYSQSYIESLPDFVELAKAFGLHGMRCEHPKDVEQAIKEMIAHDGPVIMDMMVDPRENVFPMIPAGAAHDQILLGPTEEKPEKADETSMVML